MFFCFFFRQSGFAPSTRRWIRPWVERDRTRHRSARGRHRSWSLRSPERPRTLFIKTDGWKRRRTTDAGSTGSQTAGGTHKLSTFWLYIFKIPILICNNDWGRVYQGSVKMAWWKNLHRDVQERTGRRVSVYNNATSCVFRRHKSAVSSSFSCIYVSV